MNKGEIREILDTVEKYLLSLPKDYYVNQIGKIYEKEYRHGRMRKVWKIFMSLTR